MTPTEAIGDTRDVAILRYIIAHPHTSYRQVAHAVRMSTETVIRHVQRVLVPAGLVVRRPYRGAADGMGWGSLVATVSAVPPLLSE